MGNIVCCSPNDDMSRQVSRPEDIYETFEVFRSNPDMDKKEKVEIIMKYGMVATEWSEP